MTPESAESFAREWISAWNSHDLDRILAHYSDDFTMSSPRIAEVAGEPSGILRGAQAVRRYWDRALTLTPDLHFTLIGTYLGADSLALLYRGPRGDAVEVMFFDGDGRIHRAAAMRSV